MRDSLTNTAVEGATVQVSLQTGSAQSRPLTTTSVGTGGVADIPLLTNGLYLVGVSNPGYVTRQ